LSCPFRPFLCASFECSQSPLQTQLFFPSPDLFCALLQFLPVSKCARVVPCETPVRWIQIASIFSFRQNLSPPPPRPFPSSSVLNSCMHIPPDYPLAVNPPLASRPRLDFGFTRLFHVGCAFLVLDDDCLSLSICVPPSTCIFRPSFLESVNGYKAVLVPQGFWTPPAELGGLFYAVHFVTLFVHACSPLLTVLSAGTDFPCRYFRYFGGRSRMRSCLLFLQGSHGSPLFFPAGSLFVGVGAATRLFFSLLLPLFFPLFHVATRISKGFLPILHSIRRIPF